MLDIYLVQFASLKYLANSKRSHSGRPSILSYPSDISDRHFIQNGVLGMGSQRAWNPHRNAELSDAVYFLLMFACSGEFVPFPADDQVSSNWRTSRDMLRVLFVLTIFLDHLA